MRKLKQIERKTAPDPTPSQPTAENNKEKSQKIASQQLRTEQMTYARVLKNKKNNSTANAELQPIINDQVPPACSQPSNLLEEKIIELIEQNNRILNLLLNLFAKLFP